MEFINANIWSYVSKLKVNIINWRITKLGSPEFVILHTYNWSTDMNIWLFQITGLTKNKRGSLGLYIHPHYFQMFIWIKGIFKYYR